MSQPPPRRDEHVPNIFISYRRADTSGHAGWLNDSLKQHFGERIRVFMDLDGIDYGEDFVEVVKRAVGSSLALIVVIGRQWASAADAKTGRRRLDNPDDLVRLEVATALARNIRVIPVLVEGATMPTAEELPADLAGLARRNAIEVSDARFKFDVKRLVETLERVLPPPPDDDDGREGGSKGLPPATLKKAGVALAAVALVALVSFAAWRYATRAPEIKTAPDDRAAVTNSNLSNVGGAANNSVNNAVNTNRPDASAGSAVAVNTPPATPTPASAKPGRDGLQAVRVEFGSGRAHGFFTPGGYIVTLAGAVVGKDEVTVVWRHGEQEVREIAQVVKRDASNVGASFLKLKNTGLLRRPTPIRLSASLTVNDAVERYLGPEDRTPGKVLKLRSDAEGMYKDMMVTTKISSGGDAGAPVVDAQGRIVAMVVGGSQSETISIPVETLKLSFFDAF